MKRGKWTAARGTSSQREGTRGRDRSGSRRYRSLKINYQSRLPVKPRQARRPAHPTEYNGKSAPPQSRLPKSPLPALPHAAHIELQVMSRALVFPLGQPTNREI